MTTLSLHALCRSGAVFQRDAPIPVRGTAPPGALIEVELAGQRSAGTADATGCFRIVLPALPAGGPHVLCARAAGGAATAEDILIGEVFLAAGQSNCEWPLHLVAGGSAAIAAAAAVPDTRLRLLTVPRRALLRGDPAAGDVAADALSGSGWQRADPGALAGFSAMACFAGFALRRALGADMPIGLIQAAWGGTRIAAWISPRAAQAVPALRTAHAALRLAQAQRTEDPAAHAARLSSMRAAFTVAFRAWQRALHEADGGEAAGLHRESADISTWAERTVPVIWPNAELGNHEGVVWFAVDIDVPAQFAGAPATLHLGAVDNEDTTWWNGERIGQIDQLDGPQHWALPRDYALAAGRLRAGRNRLTMRIVNYSGCGGLCGGAGAFALVVTGQRLVLPERWRWRRGAVRMQPRLPWPADLSPSVDHGSVTALFSGMIAPLCGTPLRAVWWYQGESDADDAPAYRLLLPILIQDWRAQWGCGAPGLPGDGSGSELPFCIVQLPAWRQPPETPDQRATWAELREAQADALAVPGTRLVVLSDCGDSSDIHPLDKQPVGERLAAVSLGSIPGADAPALAGPRPQSCTVVANVLHVEVACTGALRSRDGTPIRLIALCGLDAQQAKIWRWADVEIAQDQPSGHGQLILRHPDIIVPQAARVAFADNTLSCSLTDDTNLPIWPWRWPREST